MSGSHGVDLENNWGLDGVTWGFGKRLKEGAKLASFQGPANFSEPETRALRDYMQHYATGRGRVALIHVKCCSAIISPPQVYKEREAALPVETIADRIAFHMEQTDGSKYSVQARERSFHAKNQGQMIDYMHNEANVDLAFMVELKGVGLVRCLFCCLRVVVWLPGLTLSKFIRGVCCLFLSVDASR